MSQRSGLILFARTHHFAFDVLGRESGNAGLSEVLFDMVSNLAADLKQLNVEPLAMARDTFHPIDAVALEYMVAGSRMGTAVLRKRWSKARDPNVIAANHYFTAKAGKINWKETCERLDRVPSPSTQADQIISDVRRCFKLFEMAFARSQSLQFEVAYD
jgi:heme oxygenase